MSSELNPKEFRELVMDAYLTDPIPPITCMTDKALMRLEQLLRERYDADAKSNLERERPVAPKLLRKRCAQCHTCYKQREANAGCPRCAPGVQVSETEFQQPLATPASSPEPIKYQPGEWYEAKDRDDLEAFFHSRLPAIREAAREHGYAIGLHGSMRRDLDLIAAPWRDGASDKDVLAHAIAMAACGITRDGPYQWEQKPLGRVAASLPLCWPRWFNEAGAGHIDLSVVDPSRPAPGVPEGLLDWAVCRWRFEVMNRPLVNIHRRTLDDTWRQVIRFAGGNPDELIGPPHDDLLAAAQAKGDAP